MVFLRFSYNFDVLMGGGDHRVYHLNQNPIVNYFKAIDWSE